jgi:hypothetical protein
MTGTEETPRKITQAQWAIVALTVALTAGALLYRVLLHQHLGQAAAMFLGIPAVLAILLAFTPKARSLTARSCESLWSGLGALSRLGASAAVAMASLPRWACCAAVYINELRAMQPIAAVACTPVALCSGDQRRGCAAAWLHPPYALRPWGWNSCCRWGSSAGAGT